MIKNQPNRDKRIRETKNSNERHVFSNEKIKKRVSTEGKKVNLSMRRRPPTTLKTERSVD